MATSSPITIQGGGCQLGDVMESELNGPVEFYPFYCFNINYPNWRDLCRLDMIGKNRT